MTTFQLSVSLTPLNYNCLFHFKFAAAAAAPAGAAIAAAAAAIFCVYKYFFMIIFLCYNHSSRAAKNAQKLF